MSHTESHQPWWVGAEIIHNHTNGVCDFPNGPERPNWNKLNKDSCRLKFPRSRNGWCSPRCDYCCPESADGYRAKERQTARNYVRKGWQDEY